MILLFIMMHLKYLWLKEFHIFFECMFTTFLIKSNPLIARTQEITITNLYEKVYLFLFCFKHELNNLVWTLLMTQIAGNTLMTSLIRLTNSIIVNLCYIIEKHKTITWSPVEWQIGILSNIFTIWVSWYHFWNCAND